MDNVFELHEGAGFPSCNRELARKARNRRDANGFYALLELPPDASMAEIRSRCKALLRTYHPDGSAPDRAKFERIEEVYRVLGDEAQKALYDHTPEGEQWLDTETMEALREQAGGDWEKIQQMISPVRNWFSFFTYNPTREATDADILLAQRYYETFVAEAWRHGYRDQLWLVVSDHSFPFFIGQEVCVPRGDYDPVLAANLISRRFVVGMRYVMD